MNKAIPDDLDLCHALWEDLETGVSEKLADDLWPRFAAFIEEEIAMSVFRVCCEELEERKL